MAETIKEVAAEMRADMAELKISIARIEEKLPPDLDLRLDRLEQNQQKRSWWTDQWIAGLVGGACTSLFWWLFKR